MDSMRSLDRSLPRETTNNQPPQALLAAFKAAALSVTQLYKESTSLQQRERQAGYQDALDDLLRFLDKEKLGLGDGEGWSVRQWATERLDGSMPTGQDASESEDERDSKEQEESSKSSNQSDNKNVPESSPIRSSPPRESEPAATHEANNASSQQPIQPQKSDVFTFRSDIAYPKDTEMNADDQTSNTSPTELHVTQVPQLPQYPHRSRRTRTGNNSIHRHGHTLRNTSSRLGPGGGSKRKLPFPDFFGLGNLGDGKDGFGGAGGTGGGGKRGRTS